jgi:CheY-like chemotaxis protein/anti-sigma regulatory factor (Ser/Thr protein kinase)
VAHDLAQNLALIAGYAEQALSALRGEPPNSSAAFDALAIVQHAALDGGETLKRLLGFAHGRGPEEHEPVNLVDIAEDVRRLTAPRWRDQAQEEGRPIAFEVDAHGAAVIQGAAAELREAVTNLVFNAIDAMPDGGRIRVTVERLGARVDVAVVDTGAGMSPEVVGRAFEPFYSTKGVHGTGLGLSQVYGVVQRHSGVVTIESEVGRGTTVRMTFPAGDGAPSSVAPERGSAPSQSLRVLVVDDEPRLAELATVLLRQDGHRVAAVTSAEEALALLAVEHFDALVSDVSLGDGMNGWALVRRVKQSSPTIRVVLVTGWGAAIADADARARGVDAVVPKPYRGEHLRRALSG